MRLIGRNAKECGKTPLALALEYDFITNDFVQSLTPAQRVLYDRHVLNELIKEDNAAIEKSRKEKENKPALDGHPGLKKRLTLEDIAERKKNE